MNDEDILRKKLDRLNQNSHYGIIINTEITDIVRSHIKRLEETKMKATSVQTIENVKEMHFTIEKSGVDDITKVIVGASTNDDIFEFHFSGNGCVVFADQWFNMVAEKVYKTDFESERNKRKMMETENNLLRREIKELEKENNKLKTRINILTDSFTGCEKDQKIKELEKELKISKDQTNRLDKENDWLRKNYMTVAKDEEIKEKNRKINDLYHQLYQVKRDADRYKYLKTMNEEYSEQINALQRMYNLEKAANEAQHKFFINYAGRGTEIEFNYAIDDAKEVSYVIVDKKTYDEKPNINLHGKDFTPDELVDRVLELEEENNRLKHEDMLDKNAADYWSKEHDTLLERFDKLQEENEKLKQMKTPTIENFSDEPTDNVNHPSHYTGRYECIDVMQDVFGDEATNDFCLCNAFKYIWRARKKNGLEDVKKAVWYLNKYIEEAEKDGVPKGK